MNQLKTVAELSSQTEISRGRTVDVKCAAPTRRDHFPGDYREQCIPWRVQHSGPAASLGHASRSERYVSRFFLLLNPSLFRNLMDLVLTVTT